MMLAILITALIFLKEKLKEKNILLFHVLLIKKVRYIEKIY